MIYLLQSAAYNENEEFVHILKIGFTDDIKVRYYTYKSSNPTIKLLYTIEGNEDIEALLHSRLEPYRFTMKEWYRYDDYIINGFSSSKTSKDFLDYFGIVYDGTEKIGLKRIKEKFRKEIIKNITPLNNIISEGTNSYSAAKLFDSIEADIKLESDLYETIGTRYSVSVDSIHEEIVRYNTNLESLAGRVREIVDKVSIATKGYYFTDKMKLICENDLTQEEQTLLISSIAPTFRNFYTVLGPERCKALKYQKSYMQKEYDRLITDTTDDVSSVIYKNFNVGSSYTFPEIKDKLKEIYTAQKYEKKPKAVDLESYFDVITVNIPIKETGKRSKGYKLIMKKK